jgi:hypothetical protein
MLDGQPVRALVEMLPSEDSRRAMEGHARAARERLSSAAIDATDPEAFLRQLREGWGAAAEWLDVFEDFGSAMDAAGKPVLFLMSDGSVKEGGRLADRRALPQGAFAPATEAAVRSDLKIFGAWCQEQGA